MHRELKVRTAQEKSKKVPKQVLFFIGGGGGGCQRAVIELRIKFVGIIYRTSSLNAFSIFVSFNRENILSCDLP